MFTHVDTVQGLGDSSVPTTTHEKARGDHPAYLAAGVRRLAVPEDKVSWSVPWPEYDAISQARFDHPVVLKEFENKGASGWAAAPDAKAMVSDTKSYEKSLPCNAEGEALNPGGRTGIKDGRGLLGKPGPNFAADPMIFRLDPQSGELQILLIQRKDTGESALPGGMVDFGELLTQTLQRELGEETGLKLSMDDATVVYAGYVDDPRNTDKAWMETIAAYKLLSPDESEKAVIRAGSDAKSAQWRRLDAALLKNLYASHAHFIRLALAQLHVRFAEELQKSASQIIDARDTGPTA